MVLLGPFYLYNGRTRGGFYFVKGAHHGLINYLGDRRLVGHFPLDFAHVEDVYKDFFLENPEAAHAPWWEILPRWQRAHEAQGGSPASSADFAIRAGGDATRILAANPEFYALRWQETWSEFLGPAQVSRQGAATCLPRFAGDMWARFWSRAGAWFPFGLLALQLMLYAGGRPRLPAAALGPITVYLVVALANTALEPWGGQVRYRAPLQGFLVVALVVTLFTLTEWLREFRLRRADGSEMQNRFSARGSSKESPGPE